MRRRRIIRWPLVLAVLLGLGLWLMPHPEEPSYQGKTLSEWLDKFDHDSNFVDGQGRRLPAWNEDVEALRAIGTNAVPHLVKQLQKRESRLKTFVLRRLRKLYGSIPVANRRTINFFKTDFDRKQEVLEVLSVMRDQAEPAIPQLISMLEGPNERDAQLAADTIGRIGPSAAAAVPALIGKLKERKGYALSSLSGLGESAKPAVSILSQFLSDSNASFRVNSSFALATTGPAASEALPALLESLSDTNETVRSNVLWALRNIGQGNDRVMNSVSRMTNDPAPNVRRTALKTLESLRPHP